jgi:ABC-type branched-subunit amino acid transport system ATPase component
VLLLDEPAAGLARADKEALAALMGRIAQAGVTVLLVEHDMAIVMGISNHVVVLDAGTPIAEGTPQQVQQDPAVRTAYLGGAHAKPLTYSSNEGQTLLEVAKLEAGYGAEPVLKGIDLRVNDGELVAVLGANGAGKSTLMRTISGLHRPVQGNLYFEKTNLAPLAAHRIVARGVVLVPEGRQVFPELSVLDNIRLASCAERPRAVKLAGPLPALPKRLHGARAALRRRTTDAGWRGLMAKPKLLLLHEPSLGLAPQVIEDLFASLDRLRAERVTVLLVDQMAGLALSLADRAYVIEGGRISASGSAAQIAAAGALEKAYLGTR